MQGDIIFSIKRPPVAADTAMPSVHAETPYGTSVAADTTRCTSAPLGSTKPSIAHPAPGTLDSPSVMQDMTCSDLCGWLANKGREDIVDRIQEHQLEGADLLEMSAEDLEVDFEAENAEELFNLIHGKPHHYHAGEDIPSAATEFEDDGTGIATYETGAYNITCAHALCECMCVVCRCGCGCVALCVSTTMLALLPLPPTLQHPPHPST